MTEKEFDNTRFTGGMKVKFEEKEYDLVSCDFEDRTVAIDPFNDEELKWIHCSKVELVKKNNHGN